MVEEWFHPREEALLPSLAVVLNLQSDADGVRHWLASLIGSPSRFHPASSRAWALRVLITDDAAEAAKWVEPPPPDGMVLQSSAVCFVGDPEPLARVSADFRMAGKTWQEAVLPLRLTYEGPSLIGYDFADLRDFWRGRIGGPLGSAPPNAAILAHFAIGARSLSDIDNEFGRLGLVFPGMPLWASCVDVAGEDRFALLSTLGHETGSREPPVDD